MLAIEIGLGVLGNPKRRHPSLYSIHAGKFIIIWVPGV